MVKQSKKRGSRKVRCKRGGSSFSKRIASIVRRRRSKRATETGNNMSTSADKLETNMSNPADKPKTNMSNPADKTRTNRSASKGPSKSKKAMNFSQTTLERKKRSSKKLFINRPPNSYRPPGKSPLGEKGNRLAASNHINYLQVPPISSRISLHRRPPGRSNQTPTRLTSLALEVHNQKQSQIYRG
tara:strand:- start:134 stop:691 length:558 start_codon:yes stop_codon:yes gene_type:complete